MDKLIFDDRTEQDKILMLIKLFSSIITNINKIDSVDMETDTTDFSNGYEITTEITSYKYIINMRP